MALHQKLNDIFRLFLRIRLIPLLKKGFHSSLVLLGLFSGIFKECHEVVPPTLYFDNCVFDMCATGGEVVALCQAIESYADMCAANGVPVEWRTSTFCRKSVNKIMFFFPLKYFISLLRAFLLTLSLFCMIFVLECIVCNVEFLSHFYNKPSLKICEGAFDFV